MLAIYEQMSDDAYLTMINVSADGSYQLRLVPTVVNTEGLPVRAEADAFDRIAERITRLSAKLATTCRVDGDAVVIDLGL